VDGPWKGAGQHDCSSRRNDCTYREHGWPAGREPLLAQEETEMLFTLALILFVAWLLGLVGVYTIGAIVHVLLVIAIVLFLVGLISGRRTVV
jgi:hypothetical protein